MKTRYRIVLSTLIAAMLAISACYMDFENEGIGTSPSTNGVMDAGPDAQVK